jgi:hypothetical protein
MHTNQQQFKGSSRMLSVLYTSSFFLDFHISLLWIKPLDANSLAASKVSRLMLRYSGQQLQGAHQLRPEFFDDSSHSPHARHCYLPKFYPHLRILVTSPIAVPPRSYLHVDALAMFPGYFPVGCNTHDTLPRCLPGWAQNPFSGTPH